MRKQLVSMLCAGMVAAASWAGGYSDCFIPGETVDYKIYWMGIPIAWARTTTDTITEGNRELVRITLIAHTYGPYRHIYEVDDKTVVLIDRETALPVRHDWVVNEGSVHKSQLTTFDHREKTAVFKDRISKDIRVIPIEEDTREVFSFIYANRYADIEELAEQKHQLLVTGKLYDLGITILSESAVRLPEYGKVPSLELEPVAEFDGLFLRQGKVFFWISKQNPRMVTYMKADVAVGSITAKLQSVSGVENGFWNRAD